MTSACYINQRSLGDAVADNTLMSWLTYHRFISWSHSVCCRTDSLLHTNLVTQAEWHSAILCYTMSETRPLCQELGKRASRVAHQLLMLLPRGATHDLCFYFIHQNKSYGHGQFQKGGEVWFFHTPGKTGGHGYW